MTIDNLITALEYVHDNRSVATALMVVLLVMLLQSFFCVHVIDSIFKYLEVIRKVINILIVPVQLLIFAGIMYCVYSIYFKQISETYVWVAADYLNITITQ